TSSTIGSDSIRASRAQRRLSGAGAGAASTVSASASVRVASASAIGGLLLFALCGEVAADYGEQPPELFPLGLREPGKDFVDESLEPLAQAGELLPALVGQVEPASAAIVGVRATFDEPGLLEPVDHAAQRYRFDVELIGVVPLVLAGRALEQQQEPRLWAGHPVGPHPLVECASRQTRIVGKKIADVRHRARPYVKRA